ncbi:hypothetical protein P3X46_009367 [Hevea brasiliensis]|uniref:Retrotransposon gag domain-containing protein n=1 Tax=Hevea brasiliensis TaxID=3981 RepID=A0ABQ9MLP4_HEVBR|nr:hypothetical protein P3X46_009367 [Hevea brasiliensis]
MTLTGLEQKWYQILLVGSIESFEQLVSSFKQKFISYIPPKKLSSDLGKIRQSEGESLRDHVSRFNAEAIQIKKLNRETTRKAMEKGSKNIKFMDSLIKNSSWDYKQLMEKTQKHIRLDDERTSSKEKRHMVQSSERRNEKRSSDWRSYGQDWEAPWRDQYNNYTPLT